MRRPYWPSDEEKNVALLAECGYKDVKIVVSPYRICSLAAHIDHQGGTVLAMTINRGILLGFVPSGNSDVVLRSGQFKGEVRFRVNETQQPRSVNDRNVLNHGKDLSKCSEECAWGMYATLEVHWMLSKEEEYKYHKSPGRIGPSTGSPTATSTAIYGKFRLRSHRFGSQAGFKQLDFHKMERHCLCKRIK